MIFFCFPGLVFLRKKEEGLAAANDGHFSFGTVIIHF